MKHQTSLNLGLDKKLLSAVVGMLAVCAPFVARAQSDARPAFEVASVKVGGMDISVAPRRSPGRFRWTAPLRNMVSYAYNFYGWWHVTGLESEQTFYTIDATVDPAASEEKIRLMVRTLLEDRFKLVSHMQSKEVTGYALVVGKAGSKLKTANAPADAPPLPEFMKGQAETAFQDRITTVPKGSGVTAIIGRNVTTSQLADELSRNLGTWVVDETKLPGKYYFGFKFLSVDFPHDDAAANSVFSVVDHELGLKLEKRKGPGEFMVVDHFEKPTGN